MELLRQIVVLVHIVGFAVTFGAWAAEAAGGRFRFTPVMNYGLLISLLSGAALALRWPAGVEVDYGKVVAKLVIMVILGAVLGVGSARQRRTGAPVVRPLFAAAGALALLAAAIGVLG